MNPGFPGSNLIRKPAHMTTSAGIASWHGRWAAFQSRKMFWVYALQCSKWCWLLWYWILYWRLAGLMGQMTAGGGDGRLSFDFIQICIVGNFFDCAILDFKIQKGVCGNFRFHFGFVDLLDLLQNFNQWNWFEFWDWLHDHWCIRFRGLQACFSDVFWMGPCLVHVVFCLDSFEIFSSRNKFSEKQGAKKANELKRASRLSSLAEIKMPVIEAKFGFLAARPGSLSMGPLPKPPL